MAKKKPGNRKTPKRRPPSEPRPAELPERPDAEPELSDGRVWWGTSGFDPKSPLGQAQEIVGRALGESSEKKRAALAREALKVSPDCADAYVLLAENAESRKEALAQYREGVLAGERALGPELFEKEAGNFWYLLPTRPYMRARLGLAEILWTSGQREEAIGHLQEMLRLNPTDNQGVRYQLAGWLLNMDRFDDLARLIQEFDEPSATWAYTKALLEFRREGDSTQSRRRLKEARTMNKHVPAYLLGTRPMPREQPALFRYGDENEAILYAASAMGGWRATPGAMAWLRATGRRPRARKPPVERPKGPLPLVKARLRRVPQAFDVWQAEVRSFGGRMEVNGELIHPWIVLVASRSGASVLGQSVTESIPGPEQVWDVLAEAIQAPMVGERHRPTTLQVRADAAELWDELESHVEELGVVVEPVEELDFLDFVLDELRQDLLSEQPPPLLEMPGVDPPKLARFYEAAAEFYRRAPWRRLGYETAIKVEWDALESGPRYGVVMGQSGLTFGLALYDDLAILRRLWTSNSSDEKNARETVALTVTYDDAAGITDLDLDAIEQYDWEIAGSEAYPAIFRKERGMSMRPPMGWELELMEACLRVIPDFVDQHPLDDLVRHEFTVPTASGEIGLTLSWVED
jgi:tetratricopeptide (TPR) repeat protein